MNTPISVLLARKVSASTHSLPPTASVLDAVKLMNQHKLGSVLVISASGLAGIFTERDVLIRVIGLGRDPATTPLTEVMTYHPLTILPTDTVEKVMEIVTDHRVRRLPVLDAEGSIVGLISIGDLMRFLVESHKAEATSLREYVHGGEAG